MEIIEKYFGSDLSDTQRKQFTDLEQVYAEWNQKINVISRKDMDQFYERHVLHSLAIAKVCRFQPGTKILDIGCGGGFPSIPLAILFPEVHIHAVDSIGKKITVVQEVANAIGLTNIHAEQKRAENIKKQYDFIISRAVAAFPKFMPWTKGKISGNHKNIMPNGILYLKGGDLKEELASLSKPYEVHEISDFYDEEFFDTKKVIYVDFS